MTGRPRNATDRYMDTAVDIPYQTLSENAYRRIRKDIIRGKFPPDSKLRIAQLRDDYGLGASPIREALNRLVSEGLVHSVGQRGFYVPPLSLDDLHDLTETRILVETEALARSIEAGSDAWESGIVAAFHHLNKVEQRTPIDIEEREVRNRAFHKALLAACPLTTLLDIYNMLYDRHERYRSISLIIGDNSKRDLETEHQSIMQAALARDTKAAVAATRDHIQRTADIVAAALAEQV